MRQNDIFKIFNLPRWATPIICGFLLGSAAGIPGLCDEIFAGDPAQQQWPSTTADPRRDPIPQIQRGIPGIPGIHHQSEVDRTGAVERPLMSGCCDTRYCWDRYDNSGTGSRQTAAEGGSFASFGTYVMTSIRNLCLYRTYDLYVKPHMNSFTKTIYFWYMLLNVYTILFLKPHIFNIYGNI